MAAGAQAGERQEPGRGRGGAGRAKSADRDTTSQTWPACLEEPEHKHTYQTFFFFFFSLVLSGCNCRWKCMPLCVLVRRARLPLEKDLWSLISQLGA